MGAYDGESFSNTSVLADLGWRGVYVEPVEEFALLCASRHEKNDVKVYCYAISDKEETLTIEVGHAISTASKLTLEAYKNFEWSKSISFDKSKKVEAVTLDRILIAEKIKRNFELLVVDVEGYEEKVFSGFNLGHWMTKMIIVELIDYHFDFKVASIELLEQSKKVRNKILSAGYMQVYCDEINSIFVSV